jgi:hypothetical protein
MFTVRLRRLPTISYLGGDLGRMNNTLCVSARPPFPPAGTGQPPLRPRPLAAGSARTSGETTSTPRAHRGGRRFWPGKTLTASFLTWGPTRNELENNPLAVIPAKAGRHPLPRRDAARERGCDQAARTRDGLDIIPSGQRGAVEGHLHSMHTPLRLITFMERPPGRRTRSPCGSHVPFADRQNPH